MTPEQAAAVKLMRERHYRVEDDDTDPETGERFTFAGCAEDMDDEWPCTEAHVLAALSALQQRRITLTCHDCGEMFTEAIANLTASSDPEPLAPLLCQDCGDGHRAAEGGER